ncbi:amidase [Nocardia blacklockiae]|uniref:amidase n=1 Tax=Nocardia blacklockiae TaxID=480036 RepID=UPI001892EBB6|nr:amidase [Nocardia blacklockiae]MBF6170202.1 amidase [Nocardia blacklockiae]
MAPGTTIPSPPRRTARTSRRTFLAGAAGLGLAVPARTAAVARATPAQSPAEMSIDQVRRAFDAGTLSSRELVDGQLDRIAAYDKAGPAINAFITVAADAPDTAAALDRERAATGERGPLHGIPVALKDNIDTADLPTTAGNALFRDYVPGADATVTRLLREAGALVIGKTNMHEWAMGSTTVSSLGGQTRNPYDPTRTPGGSSGGTAAAVAAGFATAGLGTDTLGSIRIPAARNNCVGLRPTAGLVSRAGIIPLSTTQDTAGPITRTVADAALLLDVLAGPDPADPSTLGSGRPERSYISFLDPNALAGTRIGIVDDFFGDPADPGCAATNAVVERAIGDMAALGAQFVHIGELMPLASLAAELTEYEFRQAIDDYLARSGPTPPARSLWEIIASNTTVPDVQALLIAYLPFTTESPLYQAASAARAAMIRYMLGVLRDNRLDALLYPTTHTPAPPIDAPGPHHTLEMLAEGRSPVTGLPAITVPAGFTAENLPIGVELLGRPLDDGKLLAMAYAYEQATHHRTPPPLR